MLTSRGRTVALAALALAVAAATWLAAVSDHHAASDAEIGARMMIIVAFVVVGVFADSQSPTNPFGALLVAVGFAFAALHLGLANNAALFTVGVAVEGVWISLLIHALAIFPSGRFDSAVAVAFGAAGWLAGTVLQLIETLFLDPGAAGCTECPENLLAIWANPDAAEVLRILEGPVVGSLAVVFGIAAFWVRWRHASPLQRRSLLPVTLTGFTSLALIVAAAALEGFNEVASLAVDWIAGLTVFLIPVALLIGVLQSRISQARVAELAIALSSDLPSAAGLHEALAGALGDPELIVAYWSPGLNCFITGDGDRVELDAVGDRSVRIIEQDGRRVAALAHDPALADEPALIDGVVATASLALDNERLRAELRAQLADLQASRARIINVQDEERRRLERNLHDGAQQRLLGLGLAIRMARDRLDGDADTGLLLDEAQEELRLAISELRELARGLHPAVLTEGGLGPAVETLAERAPFPVEVSYDAPERLPEPAQSAVFYVVSEALTNATKHAAAGGGEVAVAHREGTVSVLVRDDGVGGADPAGAGLTGLADRVAAIGGTFTVSSPPDEGTEIRAEVPCE